MITSLLLFFFNEFLSEEWKIWAEYSGFESKGGKLKLIHFGLNDWFYYIRIK
jgi:hypothetical protein